MDAPSSRSRSGVFYQAMPAIGADGENIMKLIPVQMVNGQFYQSQINNPKVDLSSKKPVTINTAPAVDHVAQRTPLNPSASQLVIRKQVSLMNVVVNPAESGVSNSSNNHLLQKKTVTTLPKVPLMATLLTNCRKSVELPSQLSLTVKSPALPRGQYLQIPPNAQVRTVPASELPPGIKNQIFTSPGSSFAGSSLPNVVYVSPVTTINQDVPPPSESPLHSHKRLSTTSNKTPCGPPPEGVKPHLKLISQASQRPYGTTKWVVEEVDSSEAPNLKPPDNLSEILRVVAERENADKQHCVIKTAVSQSSHGNNTQAINIPRSWIIEKGNHSAGLNVKPPYLQSVTSEILRTVAQRENANRQGEAVKEAVSQLSPENSMQGQENALVMCNGKVFFVVKKCNLTLTPTAATSSEFNQSSATTSHQRSLESATPQTRLELRNPCKSDEVIDLCDDDAQDDSPQQAVPAQISEVSHLDEDNVIFVSYSPPKSRFCSRPGLMPTTQVAPVKEKDQMGESNSSKRVLSDLRGKEPVLSMLTRNEPQPCGSTVNDSEGSNTMRQQRTTSEQLNRMAVIADTERPADQSISKGEGSQTEIGHKIEDSTNPPQIQASPLEPKLCEMTDHQLRLIFGIAADVKICLQRIDEAAAGFVHAEHLHNQFLMPVKDEEPMSGLTEKDIFLRELYNPQEDGLKSVPKGTVQTDEECSAALLTDRTPLKCSHLELDPIASSASKQKCHLSQISLRRPCDTQTEPVIGYMEPIDKDFPSRDENNIPSPQDAAPRPQTPVSHNLSSNTGRLGRTRKRIMCPCCTPAALDPPVKSSARLGEGALITEQANKKQGRPKASRNDGASGRVGSPVAKNNQNCGTNEAPASDSLSIASMYTDELRQYEQIKRLKGLLKEKEAALELMRNVS